MFALFQQAARLQFFLIVNSSITDLRHTASCFRLVDTMLKCVLRCHKSSMSCCHPCRLSLVLCLLSSLALSSAICILATLATCAPLPAWTLSRPQLPLPVPFVDSLQRNVHYCGAEN